MNRKICYYCHIKIFYSKIRVISTIFQYFGQWVGLNLFCPDHGVGHGDELFMLFKTQKIPIESVYTDTDKATSKKILKLWTDFAKTGNPTPNPKSTQWTKYFNTF